MATSYAIVAACVAQEYDLEVVGIVNGPRCWGGETFIVSTCALKGRAPAPTSSLTHGIYL
jgi:hypothetical protein